MTLLATGGLAFLGLAALCLGMARHHPVLWAGAPARRRLLGLRAAGWTLIALSLAAALRLDGWTFGPIHWLGALTGAALLLVVTLSYRPRALIWLAPLAVAAALAAALGSPA